MITTYFILGNVSAETQIPKRKGRTEKKVRKFQGNRFTGSLKKATETQDLPQTASSKKLGEATSTSSVTKCDEMSGYRFMDVGVLINFVRDLPCKNCHNTAYTVCEKRRCLLHSHVHM